MEEEGHKIIKLNIGNLAVFGFDAPDEIMQDMIRNLPTSSGYSDSKGMFARAQGDHALHAAKGRRGRRRSTTSTSATARRELIVMAMQRAAQRRRRSAAAGARLSAVDGGRRACRAARRCTTSATRPPAGCPTSTTSARRSRRTRKAHRRHQPEQPDRRAVFGRAAASDRRDRAPARADRSSPTRSTTRSLYDGKTHTSIAALADDVLFVTFNGLSKNYRSCGYRAGWMVGLGRRRTPRANDYIEGLEHARVDAPVREHAGPVRDPDGARRLPEHQRPGRAGRAAAAASATSRTSC